MKRIILILLSATSFFPFSVFGLVAGPAKVIGTVKSFDTKIVIIENDGNKYEVPKNFVPQKTLKVGNKIELILSQEQVEKVKIDTKKAPQR